MGTSIFVSGSTAAGGFSAPSVTRYGSMFGSSTDILQMGAATESVSQGAFSTGGTLSNYFVTVSSNARTTDVVFKARLNSADTAISVTYTSGQTGTKSDTSNTATVAQDDLLSGSITTLTGGGAIVTQGSAIRFVPTTGVTASIFGTVSAVTFSGTGPITDFCIFNGNLASFGLVESDTRINIPTAGTAKYMQMNVSTNGRSTDTVVTFRKNGASGNQTFTYTSAQTGFKKDTSNTDSLSANDDITCQIALGTGTGNFVATLLGVHIDGQSVVSAGRSGRTLAAGATSYSLIGGSLVLTATEATLQSEIGTDCTASNLWCNVTSNASTTDCTVRLRSGAANVTQVVTVTALTTGQFQDTTHTDAIGVTDLLDYQFTGATTGSVVFSAISMLLSITDATAPFFQTDWRMPVGLDKTTGITSQLLGSAPNVTILVGQDALPFRLQEWPVTLGAPADRAIGAQPLGSERNNNLLIGQDTLMGASGQVIDYDWPNPVRLRDLAPGITSQPSGAPRNLNLLVGKDALPHRWRDWPNPTLLRMTPSGVTSQPLGSARIDLLTGKDKLPFRNDYLVVDPTLAQPRAIPIGAQMMGSPRLENLLVGKDALPFRQNDWPVPRGAAYDRAINSQMNGVPEGELSPAAPFAQRDWPNPTLRLSHMQALIAQAQGAALVLNTLVGQDTFFGAPGQVLDYDWPVPVGPPKWLEAISSQPLGAPAPVTFGTTAPFAKYDWPNPLLPPKAPDTQPQGSPENLTLLPGQDQLPDRQNDWPDPVRGISPFVAISAQPAGSPVNLTLLPGKDSLPIRQRDWPNPTLGKSAYAADTGQLLGSPLNLTTLVGQDALPFNQDQWPNPRGPQPVMQTQPQGQGLVIEEAETVFRNLEMPNPVLGLSRLVAILAQPQGSPTNVTLLPGKDALPFRKSDWPNPRGAIPPVQTQPQGIPNLYLTPSTPGAQYDWPLPIRPPQPVQTQPYGSPRLLNLLVGRDALPVRQQDWPNPIRPRQPTLSQPLGVLLSPLAPFFKTDWPNPILPISRIAALGAQALGRVISLGDPFAQTDWPLPQRRADRHPAVTAQPLGGVTRPSFPSVAPQGPNPVLAISPWAAIEAQPVGCPSVLTLYPGQDFLPFRQNEWPVPPGPPPRTQTQRQGVSPNQRRPAPPPIINKPPMTGTETPISLAASEVAPTLLGSEVPVNLSANEDQANLAGEKSSADLSGEVDQ